MLEILSFQLYKTERRELITLERQDRIMTSIEKWLKELFFITVYRNNQLFSWIYHLWNTFRVLLQIWHKCWLIITIWYFWPGKKKQPKHVLATTEEFIGSFWKTPIQTTKWKINFADTSYWSATFSWLSINTVTHEDKQGFLAYLIFGQMQNWWH